MSREHKNPPRNAGSGDVKDPVCGMNVSLDSAAAKTEHNGRTYYFCCLHCMEEFRANPGKYAPQG